MNLDFDPSDFEKTSIFIESKYFNILLLFKFYSYIVSYYSFIMNKVNINVH